MPIYEFVCEACGRLVERLQKISDPPPDACPECGGKMAKIMSRNSFQLKGGGWYRDLYSSTSGKPSGDSAKSSAPAGGGGSSKEGAAGTTSAPASPAPAAAPSPAPAKKD